MLIRLWRHLTTTRWTLRHHFPEARLAEITAAVRGAEQERRGQIVVALEAALPLDAIHARTTARTRAQGLFASLGVWDTDANNGVLIYLLLADHAIEIIADRNAARQLAQADWTRIVSDTAALCAQGQHPDAILHAIAQVRGQLQPDAPDGSERNELPDRPVIL